MQTREQSLDLPPLRDERDSQRLRVYVAERSVRQGISQKLTETEIRARVRSILNSRRVEKAFPFMRRVGARDIHVEFAGRTSSWGGADGIIIGAVHHEELIVLHEMAHLIHHRERDFARGPALAIPLDWRQRKGYTAGHGWRFAMIYLQLVLWFIGRGAHDALKHAFKSHKVRFRPPRVYSQEQRAALAARLQKYRGDVFPLRMAAAQA